MKTELQKASNETSVRENPLVSIVVITYNSSKYVLETLESVCAQTYQNIDLIVSDDCSTDNTVEICHHWLEENKKRFVRTELITVGKNTGISANCNRGINAAYGEWIKIIAGDDILLASNIEENIRYIRINTSAKIVFSGATLFTDNEGEKRIIRTDPLEYQKSYFDLSAQEQYSRLLENNFIWVSLTSFIKKTLLLNLGLFDIKYPWLEDYPFWLKTTKNGEKIYFFDSPTALYRIHNSSIFHPPTGVWINKNFFDSHLQHFKDHVSRELKRQNKSIYFSKKLYFFKMQILIMIFRNRKSYVSKLFNRLVELFFKTSSI